MPSKLDTGEMVDGKKHGYWITYYANGVKRSEGNYIHGKKMEPGSLITKMGTNLVKLPSAMENMKVLVSAIMKTGILDPAVPILNMRVNLTMAKRKDHFMVTKKMAKRCG